MDPDAIALFRELADRPPSEREDYYARHEIPAALRNEIESLLRFDADTGDDIRGRVASAAARALLERLGALRARLSATPSEETTHERFSSAFTSEIGEGRFPAGTLLGGRYRIVSLLGRGGMGEVYRASDLKLRQPVALKFLPEATARDLGLLARFHDEVRLARQLSHPNICRVYDIGEVDGAAFISMEYIDGEDLASLLRRIGHLPHDKALEIARRLCAGLAAAHNKGVVHRDLKPANIMIDGRGNVFITDFGLASTARRLAGADVRSGTPAYMAPEQLEGREVSVHSDLYALGLVFYEMFTGRRPFDQSRRPADRPPSISSVARDIDPAVVRTIERCIEADPRDRPSSAMAVAAALPGGNPLADALAAGLTPSPQMVAASEDSEALSVRAAMMAIVVVVVGLVITVAIGSRVSFLHVTPFENPPEALLLKAREILAGLGYTASPVDRDWSYFWNGNYQRYAEAYVSRAEYLEQLARGQPPLINFRYRQSAQYLLLFDPAGQVTDSRPPPRDASDVYLALDQLGRLVNLEVVPSEEEYSTPSTRTIEWETLFALGGVDRSRFTPTAPRWIPSVTFDTRVAWTGTYAHTPTMAMRIEAASWKGRPTYFRIFTPVGPAFTGGRRILLTGTFAAGLWLYYLASWVLLVGAALVAWRNHKLGRSDLRGVSRLATGVFVCGAVGWILTAHHVPTYDYVPSVFRALGTALTAAVIGGLLYMAAEPFVRSRWPQSLITWTRLLSGRVRDPLVGGHVLVGMAYGIGMAIWLNAKAWWLLSDGLVTGQDSMVLQGAGWTVSSLLWNLVGSVAESLSVVVLFLLSRIVLRRDWLATLAVVGIEAAVTGLLSARPLIEAVFAVPATALSLWILIRLGVLPTIIATYVANLLTLLPLTTDFTAWSAGPTLFVVGTVIVLAIGSFRVALAGRPVLQDEFLEASG
jgi:predicted Ser/Thr protein kinase